MVWYEHQAFVAGIVARRAFCILAAACKELGEELSPIPVINVTEGGEEEDEENNEENEENEEPTPCCKART